AASGPHAEEPHPPQSLRAWDLRSDARATAGRCPDEQPTAERLDAIGEAPEATAALRVGAADSVVDHLDDDLTALPSNFDRRGCRLRVLADVGEAFRDDVVGRDLEWLLEPSIELDQQADRKRGLGDDRFQGDFQPVSAQHGGVDSAGDVAKLLEREGYLVPRLIEAGPRLGVGREPLFEQAELEGEGNEPLLCAVVEVSLQPLPLL